MEYIKAGNEIPELICSADHYDFEIDPREKCTRTLAVRAADGRKISGLAVSDHRRILIAENEFSGTECGILFGIDTDGLSEGDSFEGSLQIISSLSEETIPVHVRITEKNSPLEGIKNLDEFTELARHSQREAFQIFLRSEFERLLTGEDAKYRSMYRILKAGPANYQNMEEFLIASGRKEPTCFHLEEEEVVFPVIRSDEKGTIYLYRNSWGVVQLEIEVIGNFIRLPKKRVHSEDFVGRVCALDYVLDASRIGDRKCCGKVIFHGMHQDITFRILANSGQKPDRLRKEQEKTEFALEQGLLRFCLNQETPDDWHREALSSVRSLRQNFPENVNYLLYEAWLDWRHGDNAKALEVLWPVKDGSLVCTDPRQRCVYRMLALRLDLLPEEQRDILPELSEAAEQMPESFLLQYLLREGLDVSETSESVLRKLRACFDAGSRSPFLYLEALRLYESNELYLKRLDDFSIQVLNFARKHRAFSAKLLLRAAFLSHNLKRYSPMVYRILKDGWRENPDDEVLEAICQLIILGNPVRRDYHRWYQLAVEKNLRITNVYEYYIRTIDPEDQSPLPDNVLLYFADNPVPGERARAYLYANILRTREEDISIYALYQGRIREFAAESIAKGIMNEDYAELYRKFFAHPKNGREAALLAGVLFRRKLTVKSGKDIRRVIVRNDSVKEERTCAITGGVAYVDIYNERDAIVLEDDERRKYASGIPYDLKPMMDVGTSGPECLKENIRKTGLLLYGCGENAEEMRITGENLSVYRLAESYDALTDEYRMAVRKKLLEYYLSHPEDINRLDFLRKMDPIACAEADKAATVRLLMEEGKYDAVYEIVSDYGYENVPDALILSLAGRIILEKDSAYDEELLYMSDYIFEKGRYNDLILGYLLKYYEGPVQKLCKLWKCAKGFGLDAWKLEETILKQSVFAHIFPEEEEAVFEGYLRGQGKEIVIAAYLAHASDAYLLEEREMPESLFREIRRLYSRGADLTRGSRLALLKHYSEQEELEKEETDICARLMEEFQARGIRMAFMKKLPLILTEKYQIEDKSYIEERFPHGSRILLHYRIREDGSDDGEWIREPMREVYRGIFVKELLLFYGEEADYHLSIVSGKETTNLEQKKVVLPERKPEGRSRFKLLNRMRKADLDGDAKDRDEAMRRYLWQEAFVDAFIAK